MVVQIHSHSEEKTLIITVNSPQSCTGDCVKNSCSIYNEEVIVSDGVVNKGTRYFYITFTYMGVHVDLRIYRTGDSKELDTKWLNSVLSPEALIDFLIAQNPNIVHRICMAVRYNARIEGRNSLRQSFAKLMENQEQE